MLFEIGRDTLLEGLSKTTPLTERKSTLPILSHLLLTARESELIMTATDLETGLQVTCDCTVSDPGSVAVPARKAFEIVRELPSGTVKVELLDTGRLGIEAGQSAIKLAVMDPTDYPAWSAFENVEKVPVPAQRLVYMIDKTIFAASTDESRFNLNGILVEQQDDKTTRLVATDGHRLATIDENIGFSLTSKVLIPRKSLLEIRRILDSVEGEIQVGFEPKNVVITAERFTMTARLIEGDYPDYRKVVPPRSEVVIKAQRSALIQTLKRVAVLTPDRNKGIGLDVSPGGMEMTATHPDLGTARDSIDVDYQGDKFSVLINVDYLLDSLDAIDTDEIIFEYRKEGSPIVIRPFPEKDYFNLVMPMRK
jgi:DNA polymerase-3 subunit beta